MQEAAKTYWQHKSIGMAGRDYHKNEMEACRESAARILEKKTSEISFCSEAYNLLGSALGITGQAKTGCCRNSPSLPDP